MSYLAAVWLVVSVTLGASSAQAQHAARPRVVPDGIASAAGQAGLAIDIDLSPETRLVGLAAELVVEGVDVGAPTALAIARDDAEAFTHVGTVERVGATERVAFAWCLAPDDDGAWSAAPSGRVRVARADVSTWTRHPDVPVTVHVESMVAHVVGGDGVVRAARIDDGVGWNVDVAPRVAPIALRFAAAATPLRAPLRAGDPFRGVTPDQRARFELGHELFARVFHEADGLGPAFNDFSCLQCHKRPAPGGGDARTVTRFGRAGPPFDAMVARGGPLLQFQSIHPACEEFLPPEADIVILRLTPPLFGLGLVDVLDDAQLDAVVAGQPDDVRGRVPRVAPLEGGAPRAGRFGWKSQLPSLLSFTADATLFEMGLTNVYLPDESPPSGRAELLSRYDVVDDPELRAGDDGVDPLDLLVDAQRLLAPPPQTPPRGHAGEGVFTAIGCATCHVPRWTTPPDAPAPLADVTFGPYSDFALHDMGALGDGVVDGEAGPSWMRTAPLWGLATRTAFLHDGRAVGAGWRDDVAAAIDAHDGQGRASAATFAALEPAERESLLDFLATLGRPAGDVDGDLDVDPADLRAAVLAARAGSAPSAADLDADGDVDARDLLRLQLAAGDGVGSKGSLTEDRTR